VPATARTATTSTTTTMTTPPTPLDTRSGIPTPFRRWRVGRRYHAGERRPPHNTCGRPLRHSFSSRRRYASRRARSLRGAPASRCRPRARGTQPMGAENLVRPSCGSFVFVNEAAEAIAAADVGWVARWSRCGGWQSERMLIERPGRPVSVVVVDVGAKDASDVTSVDDRSRHSRRIVPTSRSANAFAFGARTAVRTIWMPSLWRTASKAAVNFASRSRIRNRIGASPG
jgi:hypothetical protein